MKLLTRAIGSDGHNQFSSTAFYRLHMNVFSLLVGRHRQVEGISCYACAKDLPLIRRSVSYRNSQVYRSGIDVSIAERMPEYQARACAIMGFNVYRNATCYA